MSERARIVVDNRIRIHGIDANLAQEVRDGCTHANPKREAMRRGNVRGWWNEPSVIATWLDDEDGAVSAPRGAMERVRTLFRERGVGYTAEDRRTRGRAASIPASNVELWEHQRRIVDACLARENCLVKSSTGSGKTSALLYLASVLQIPTLVVVHSRALLDQWIERADRELGISEKNIGVFGGGRARVHDLTIGIQKSVMNASTDPAFVQEWGAILCDEVHLFAARSFFACVDPFPARFRIGVSDDTCRKDGREFLIHDLFGKVEEEVSHEEMVEAGHVMDVEVLIVPSEFRADWYSSTGADDKSPDYGRLLTEMANDPKRNQLIERLLKTELEEGRQCIVFARERTHCQVLGTIAAGYAPAGHLLGGADFRNEFERTRAGLKAGKIRAAVGTFQACGTGVDLPGAEVGIAAVTPLANRQMFRQARGRVCRKPAGKTVARFYVIHDQHVFGVRHLENAARWNDTTFVWDGSEWVPVRAYIKALRAKEI